jgi:hypothetical protein
MRYTRPQLFSLGGRRSTGNCANGTGAGIAGGCTSGTGVNSLLDFCASGAGDGDLCSDGTAATGAGALGAYCAAGTTPTTACGTGSSATP